MADLRNVRKDFPILSRYPELVYLDSACTSLKPNQVIDAEMSYYKEYGACGSRSSHFLGRRTNEKVEATKDNVAKFVNADPKGLIWTKNTSEAMNLVAHAFDFSGRRKVVTTVMEHHSVLLPFMKLRDQGKIDLEIIPCDPDGEIPIERWESAIDKETALVVCHNWNNTTGTGRDIRSISRIAHAEGALVCIDGAQGVPHHKTDQKAEGIDFLAFSGHKMLGPTGIGVLTVRTELLPKLSNFVVGGGTITNMRIEKPQYQLDTSRFEAGVQHYSGMFGLAAACDYLRNLGMDNIVHHEKLLAKSMREAIEASGAIVYGPKQTDAHGALFSFNFKGAKPQDVALMLDKLNIAVRGGFFCAQPGMEALGANEGAVRASAYVYTSLDDIKRFDDALRKAGALYS